MLKKNVGGLERVIRILVGVALLAGFFLLPEASYRWFLLIGIVPLVTGFAASCPIYSLLGISTCRVQ